MPDNFRAQFVRNFPRASPKRIVNEMAKKKKPTKVVRRRKPAPAPKTDFVSKSKHMRELWNSSTQNLGQDSKMVIPFKTAQQIHPSIATRDGGGKFVSKSHTSGTTTGYITPYPDGGSSVDLEILKLLKSAGDFQSLDESDYFDLTMWLYENLPIAQMVVMGTTDHVMAEGIGVELAEDNKKLKTDAEEFLDFTDTYEKMFGIVIQILLFGNSFAIKAFNIARPKYKRKFLNYTIEDTRTFTDISRNRSGKLIYKQEGSTEEDFKRNADIIELEWTEDEVVQFKAYTMSTNERWGRSLFRGTIGLCMTMFNALGDLATIIKRYSAPIMWLKLEGLPTNSSRRDSVMSDFANELEKQSTRDEWITDEHVDIKVIESAARSVNVDLWGPIERHLVGAFAYPRHLLMDVGNRSVADDLDLAFMRRIRALQKSIANTFTEKILRPAMIDKGYDAETVKKIRFVFNKQPELERELFMKAQKNAMLANAFILHPNEIREREYGILTPFPGGGNENRNDEKGGTEQDNEEEEDETENENDNEEEQ